MTTDGRFRRLLLALPHFGGTGQGSLTEVAATLGIDRDLLLEDLHALAERYDEPAAFEASLGVLIDGDTVTVRAGRFRRPMRLSAAELCALELGLLVMARESPDDGAIRRLRDRVDALIGELPRDRDVGGRRDGAFGDGRHAATLEVVRGALRDRRVLGLQYAGSRDQDERSRTVHPHQLTFARGTWYLTAWCEEADGVRVFRVDRITAISMLDAVAREAPATLADQTLADGTPFVVEGSVPSFTVRYSAAIARWIVERDGGPVEADGSALRTMPLADREWAIRHVLQYGPDATIVSPAELREEVVGRLRRMVDDR